MPQRRKLQNLAAMACDNIVDNMGMWCNHFVGSMLNESHWLYVIGPFSSLPPHLCQEIFHRLRMVFKNKLRKEHVYLLIQPGMKHLDLSTEKSDLQLLLGLLSVRVPTTLLSLDLSGCTIPRNKFLEVFPNFVNLRILRLANCRHWVKDEHAALIGKFASNLTSLDLSFTHVGDQGVEKMIHSKLFPYGRCQKLNVLNLEGSHATDNSTSLALQELTCLTQLRCPNSANCVYKSIRSKPQTFHLRYLHFIDEQDDSFGPDMIQAVAHACPEADNLTFQNYPCEDLRQPLSFLFSTRMVKELSIDSKRVEPPQDMSFTLSLALSHDCSSLTRLEIQNSFNVDVLALLQHCSNLQTLQLFENEHYASVTNDREIGDLKLETLEIVIKEAQMDNDRMNTLHPAVYQDLLIRSPSLKKLSLHRALNLMDEHFEGAFLTHGFKNLEHLDISAAWTLQFKTFLPLLKDTYSPLHTVKFSNCRLMTINDYETYERYVQKKKLANVIRFDWN